MCVKSVISCVLVIANLVIMLAGTVILTIGALIQWGGPPIYRYISPVLGAIVSGSSAVGQSNFSATISEVNSLMGQYVSFLGSVGLILFFIGAGVAALGILGCVGACCTLKILLIVYVVLVGAFFVLSLIFVILVFTNRSSVENWGGKSLLKVVQESYVGFNDSKQSTEPAEGVSRILDVIQVKLNCCGVYNYTDFKGAKHWNRDYYINNEKQTLETPLSCCKMKGHGITPIEPKTCATKLDPQYNNFETPCYPKLWKAVDTYSMYFAYSLVGFTAVLLIIVILTSCLIR